MNKDFANESILAKIFSWRKFLAIQCVHQHCSINATMFEYLPFTEKEVDDLLSELLNPVS